MLPVRVEMLGDFRTLFGVVVYDSAVKSEATPIDAVRWDESELFRVHLAWNLAAPVMLGAS